MKMELEEIDKKLLRVLQKDLPVVKEPFAEIARSIGISEDEVFSRIKRLSEKGIIRKFGLRIDSKKAGFASTLVAMKVPESEIDDVAERVNQFEGVTHNYARDNEYNLWFTVIEKDEGALNETLKAIERKFPHVEMINLPVLKKFKIDVRFKI